MKRMNSKCSICGRQSSSDNPVFNNICFECLLSKEPNLIFIPSKIDVKICSLCNAVFIQNNWTQPLPSINSAIEVFLNYIINNKIKVKNPLKLINVDVTSIDHSTSEVHVKLKLTLSYGFSQVVIYRDVVLILKRSLCNSCFRKRAKVYEAIIQIRSSKPKNLETLRTKMNNLFKHLPRSVVDDIVEVKDVRDGIDLYVTSKEAARYIASKFSHYYLAKVIETHKVIGRDRRGKRKSRITLSVRIPDIDVRDIVEFQGKPAIVKRITGNSIILKVLDSDEEVKVSNKDYWDKGIVKKIKELAIREAQVLTVKPDGEVMLMDLETYEVYNVTLTTPIKVKKGDVVKVLIYGGKVYVLP